MRNTVRSIEKELEKNLDKLFHALNGSLAMVENETGIIYNEASKAECDEYILTLYRDLSQRFISERATASAFSRLLKENNVSYSLEKVNTYKKEAAGE